MMWILTVRSPVSEPCEYTLKPGVQRIGHDAGNAIILSDHQVSHVHAEIQLDTPGRHVILTDLGSTNGTFV